jgi:DNA-directed RNA polymerase specialized sigma54-like protein
MDPESNPTVSAPDKPGLIQTDTDERRADSLEVHRSDDLEAYLRNARAALENNQPEPKTDFSEFENFRKNYEGALEMRQNGRYEFLRFENTHLLSLCHYRDDIGHLRAEIEGIEVDTDRANPPRLAARVTQSQASVTQLQPEGEATKQLAELLREKLNNMRELLKAYSRHIPTPSAAYRVSISLSLGRG